MAIFEFIIIAVLIVYIIFSELGNKKYKKDLSNFELQVKNNGLAWEEVLKFEKESLKNSFELEKANIKAELDLANQSELNRLDQDWTEKHSARELEFQNTLASEVKNHRADANKKSRISIKSKISEEMCSILPGFPYNTSDLKHFGSPLDFIVLDGMTEYRDGEGADIKNIIFLDIKTGKARLTKVEAQIKKAIEEKRVLWQTINVSEDGQFKIE